MGRATGKRMNKSSTQSKPTSSATPTTVSSSSGPPKPFAQPPASLRHFLSTLPTHHVYLVHVDRTPTSLKRQVFVVPVILNLIITALLCVRIYYAAPQYLEQLITIFGYETEWKIDTRSASRGDLLGAVTSRTFLLMLDYAIFGLLGNWPKEFVFGGKASRYTGPLTWRRRLGFKESEIIVRRGRKWDTPLLVAVEEGQTKTWSTEEELTLKFKIEPAMRQITMSKTGYLLLDKDWDIDFKAILDVHRLIDGGNLALTDLDNLALVYYQSQWLFWRVHETTGIPVDDSQDSTLRRFKDKLTELDQEDLFYRWIEIVQFNTSQPGSFTERRQAEAMRELNRLLSDRGADYAQFWDDIGGKAGLPGLEAQKN